MELVLEKDPQRFLEKVEPLLLKREAENNLPLGILHHLVRQKEDAPPLLIYGKDEGEIVSMTMRTPPHLWILPSIALLTREQVEAMVLFMSNNHLDVPGVLGEETAIQWFVEAWENLHTSRAVLHMKQVVHQLKTLKEIKAGKGQMIVAKAEHQSLLKTWFEQYAVETGEEHVKNRTGELVAEGIQSGTIHLWVLGDGTPVSMASRARETKHGATINAVYTPDLYKRNGYATQAVWHLTQKLLTQGYQFCALYTDLDNPVSNSIYQKIGYEEIGRSVVYHMRK
ncbi:GNAT family N-acetyltransferase [Halobacillus fulvus]|nr:GNAT family N-acetyltransferase [Halobacillus fulvus]